MTLFYEKVPCIGRGMCYTGFTDPEQNVHCAAEEIGAQRDEFLMRKIDQAGRVVYQGIFRCNHTIDKPHGNACDQKLDNCTHASLNFHRAQAPRNAAPVQRV